MSQHISPGDMVEGQKTKIEARKILFKNRSLQKHEITKKFMVTYNMDRNCSVEVIEKIELTEAEMKNRAELPIYGEVGESLIADAIRLYVNGMRDILGVTIKEGVSHRHGANIVHCPYHAIAKIQTPWQGHQRALGMTANTDTKILIK